mmetsp:Transcript_95225/g.199149  ORF Transcript_95225/g.199149 Transcript_95225/m.199149 type:complete len:216 (-) Transcript_95225:15-662(-)
MEVVVVLCLNVAWQLDVVAAKEIADTLLTGYKASQDARVAQHFVHLPSWQSGLVVPLLGEGSNLLVQDRSEGGPELVVSLLVVRRETSPSAHGLGVGHHDILSLLLGFGLRWLGHGADLQLRIAGFVQDGGPVQAEEEVGAVLAGHSGIHQRRHASRMEATELADVVDLAIDDDPQVPLLVVLGDLLHAEFLQGSHFAVEEMGKWGANWDDVDVI